MVQKGDSHLLCEAPFGPFRQKVAVTFLNFGICLTLPLAAISLARRGYSTMSKAFDPYHKWLGIQPHQQPASHYRLLGISEFEDDPDVIAHGADLRTRFLQDCQKGEHAEDAKKLLEEVAAARLCLLDTTEKARYDRRLRAAQAKATPERPRAIPLGQGPSARVARPKPQPVTPAVSAAPPKPAPAAPAVTAASPKPQPVTPAVSATPPKPAPASPAVAAASPKPAPATWEPAPAVKSLEAPRPRHEARRSPRRKAPASAIVLPLLLAGGAGFAIMLLLIGMWLFRGGGDGPRTVQQDNGRGDGSYTVPAPARGGSAGTVVPAPADGGSAGTAAHGPAGGGPDAIAVPPGAGDGQGLIAELYKGRTFGRKLVTRVDRQVHFLWGGGRPDPLVEDHEFSVRWTGWLKAPRPGWYRLLLLSDDGVRLWLDDELIIDGWRNHPIEPFGKEVELGSQPHALRIEYFEDHADANIVFLWECAGFGTLHCVPAEVLFHDREAAQRAVIDPSVLYGRPGHAPETLAQTARVAESIDSVTSEPVDLLRLIDPTRDGVRKQWWFQNGVLYCTRGSPCIQVPYTPPAEYEITLVVKRLQGKDTLGLGLIAQGRQFGVVLDGWGGRHSGVERIDGARVPKNETVRQGRVLTNGQPSTITISVQQSQLTVKRDGEMIVDWAADYGRVSPESGWLVPYRRGLSLQ
jgi:hypothetical protein